MLRKLKTKKDPSFRTQLGPVDRLDPADLGLYLKNPDPTVWGGSRHVKKYTGLDPGGPQYPPIAIPGLRWRPFCQITVLPVKKGS